MPLPSKAIAHQIANSKTVFFLVLLPCIFLFPRIISVLNAESFAPGDAAGEVYVASASERGEQPFELVPFYEASRSASFITCPKRDLIVHTGEFETIECHILEQKSNSTVIETVKADDDYSFISRYRIEGHRVIPMMRRVFGPSQGFAGLVLAIVFCKLLFFVLRCVTWTDADHVET